MTLSSKDWWRQLEAKAEEIRAAGDDRIKRLVGEMDDIAGNLSAVRVGEVETRLCRILPHLADVIHWACSDYDEPDP